MNKQNRFDLKPLITKTKLGLYINRAVNEKKNLGKRSISCSVNI